MAPEALPVPAPESSPPETRREYVVASSSEPVPAAEPPEVVPAAGEVGAFGEAAARIAACEPAATPAVEPGAPFGLRSQPDPDDPQAAAEPAPIEAPWWRSARAVAALVAVAVAQAVLSGWLWSRPSAALGGDGELVVQSRPDGARVVVDDREHGVTPLTIRVSPGAHVLQVRAGTSEPRVIPLLIRPGVQTAQYVELMGVATTGVLEVRSEPSKARVTIDGQDRGSTPLTLRDVAPGDYQIVLERAGWKTAQVVRVEPGATAQLVVPIR